MGGLRKIVFMAFSLMLSSQVYATTIIIVNRDGAGEGLNSAARVAPVQGNSATTLGAQYLNVFRAAAEFWEGKLDSSVPIRVDAQLDPLSCSPNSGVLGSAGPLNGFVDFPNAPRRNTIYVVAQANSLAGRDLDPNNSDLSARFNSSVGSSSCLTRLRWWLGINSPAPAGTISLFDTVLHEIGHGVGFLSLVDQDGRRLADLNDTFMLNLFDRSQNRAWSAMTNSQRRSSSINNGGLVWSGSNVRQGAGVFAGGRSGGLLRMYAPRTFSSGSSVSHWDTVVSPDELMEPFATPTSDSCATVLALRDMGWRTMNECVAARSRSPIIAPIFLLLDDE